MHYDGFSGGLFSVGLAARAQIDGLLAAGLDAGGLLIVGHVAGM